MNNNYEFAVFLHMGNIKLWDSIKPYLKRVSIKFQLYVSFIKDTPDNKEEIIKIYPETIFFWNENKGADIGPFFIFMNYLRENNIKHKWITKIHTKTDPNWRGHMYEYLFPLNFKKFYNELSLDKKMYGAFTHSYDYMNIYYDIKNIELLGINLITSWDKFTERHTETKGMSVLEKAIYAIVEKKIDDTVPDIDVELYKHLFGEIVPETKLIKNIDKYNAIYNLTKPLFKLNYYPGTCFIFSQSHFEDIFKNINYIDIFNSLEPGKLNDNLHQSNTHSWERIIPIALLHNN
jgi:hypothetical protein